MGDQEGFRLKTIKLRGQVSQGLILPMSVFGDFGWTAYEGLDVTEMLGIQKYEPPVPAQLAGKAKGNFPGFIQKTDEERVQNLTRDYQGWKLQSAHQFYAAEKLDGSSATFYLRDGQFGVCSRNLELVEVEDNTFWKVAREMKIEERLRELGRNIAIQGELIGEGVQGNPYKIKGHTVRFFNVFDIDTFQKLGLRDLTDIIVDTFGFQTVPIIEAPFTLPETVGDLLQIAEGKSVLNPQTEREGLVIRSLDNTISFKAISNKFLLKNE